MASRTVNSVRRVPFLPVSPLLRHIQNKERRNPNWMVLAFKGLTTQRLRWAEGRVSLEPSALEQKLHDNFSRH